MITLATVPTAEHARKIAELAYIGACKGLGEPEPGKMCIGAIMCCALGERHGSLSTCCDNTVGRLQIILNDRYWSSDAVRGAGMAKVAIAQLGSKDAINEQDFLDYTCLYFIQDALPLLLKIEADKVKDTARNITDRVGQSAIDSALTQIEHVKKCKKLGYFDESGSAFHALGKIEESTRWLKAGSAVAAFVASIIEPYYDSTEPRTIHIRHLQNAIIYSEVSISGALVRDSVLKAFANAMLKALIKVKSPGCEWLHFALTE